MSEATYIAGANSQLRKSIDRIGLTIVRSGNQCSEVRQDYFNRRERIRRTWLIIDNLFVLLTDSAPCSRLPICDGNAEDTSRYCLYLTMIEGKSAIRLGNFSKNNSTDSLMLEPNLA
jgi:hypothetical protein